VEHFAATTMKSLIRPQKHGPKRSALLEKYPEKVVPNQFYYWLWSTTPF